MLKTEDVGLKSQILQGKKSGKYFERTNIIAGLTANKPIAPLVFNGTCNTELFNSWTQQFLIKELEPGQVVILDNATFHKSKKTKELIESVGCRVIFLPTYSLDLNPIEKFWANIKDGSSNKSSISPTYIAQYALSLILHNSTVFTIKELYAGFLRGR